MGAQAVKRKVLTTGEVADYCGVRVITVLGWIQKGLLKAYKLPGRGDNRIEAEDFVAFLKANAMPIPRAYEHHARRILIVEDDPPMARIIMAHLDEAGFETLVASDGFRAGACIESFRPSVVTLDLMIPGLSGIEVLKFIREQNHLKDVKILVVSGMPKAKLDEALQAGADATLSKPFETDVLVAEVTKLAGVSNT
jgi:excisionase family DNA binding protein